MGRNKLKLLEETNGHQSNEQKAIRSDAKSELFKQAPMNSSPPTWLPPSAVSEWQRLLPVLKKDFPLSETDYGLLVSYCLAYARIKTAEGDIRKYGTFITNVQTGSKKPNPAVKVQSQAMKDLKASASALGMTLEVRSRLAFNKAKEQALSDPFAELMKNE